MNISLVFPVWLMNGSDFLILNNDWTYFPYFWQTFSLHCNFVNKDPEGENFQYECKQITAWEVLVYGTYALVCLFHETRSLIRFVNTSKLVRN